MCSKPSSSLAALALAAALSGCANGVKPLAQPTPTRVYVNVEKLLSRYPSALKGLSVRSSEPPAPARWEARLPSFRVGATAPSGRRDGARKRFQSVAESERLAYLAGLAEREGKLIDQRRAELLAAERGAQSERERGQKIASDARTRSEIERRADTLSALRTAERVYNAQLKAGVLGGNPDRAAADLARLRTLASEEVRDLETLKEAVKALKPEPGKGPQETFRPAPRTRMQAMAEAAAAGRRRVEDEIDTVWKSGQTEREAAVLASQRELLDRIERRLAELRTQGAGALVSGEIRQEVARTLLAERSQAGSSAIRTAEERRVGVTMVGSAAIVGSGSAGRVGEQKALLREDLLARLRDAAERRHLALQLTSAPGLADRTEEFAGWLGLKGGRS